MSHSTSGRHVDTMFPWRQEEHVAVIPKYCNVQIRILMESICDSESVIQPALNASKLASNYNLLAVNLANQC
eukprot:CAMPEP_0204521562 /NCGR_PEP_ID=MMETSP0661-20131031/5846_1 /ASSEMBLY_ACC=CAM_ASM_000606 /TAXON_ID=109239 /ORGANISM="Alexandrium margalefi, Strain AMGDE01CS-322" /LENGTH=71 /DNA_ID=CAMNT_0051527167 /DNA_START=477 /DNA_END=692 /DNA_ORIENTATION=-